MKPKPEHLEYERRVEALAALLAEQDAAVREEVPDPNGGWWYCKVGPLPRKKGADGALREAVDEALERLFPDLPERHLFTGMGSGPTRAEWRCAYMQEPPPLEPPAKIADLMDVFKKMTEEAPGE